MLGSPIKASLAFLLIILLSGASIAQDVPERILSERWRAYWIEESAKDADEFTVVNFRKKIALQSKPERFVVHVSADNRYKLYVNGSIVSTGPAKSDLHYWNFETVDLAPYLKTGDNIVTSVVWNFGKDRPLNQFSHRTAFIIQGDSPKEDVINSDSSWRCFANKAYSPVTPDLIYTYYAAGPGEALDYNSYPAQWTELGFDEKRWHPANQIVNGIPKGVFDYSMDWMLVPRDIPPMEMTPQRFASVRETTTNSANGDLLNGSRSVTIPANAKHTIILDQGHLTNAYPLIVFRKGTGSMIRLTYVEALYIDEGTSRTWKAQKHKGNRNEISGKRFVGVTDQIMADGKAHEFTTLNWHTFRYLKLEVETKAEELIIEKLASIFTAYPFTLRSTFKSDDKTLSKILDVGWRTARLCAEESYMDTPYYERLQYFGDTRIQALISLYNTGDDRLVKRAIRMGDISRLPEGVTQSRYPSAYGQIIPPFSLYWIGMLHDYYYYGKDTEFVKEFLTSQRQVLNFFSKYESEDGRLRKLPYWKFTDWVETSGWNFGVPPIGNDGCSAILDFQLLDAYQKASFLEESIGSKEFAEVYKAKARRLMESIQVNYWDDGKELYADTKEKTYFSQHTSTLAILTNTIAPEKANALAQKLLNDTTLTQATIYYKYYVHQAISKAGLGDHYIGLLGDWRKSLDYGLTTLPETSDVNNTRSDCHAWASSPNIEFYRIVLGISSQGAGFKQIKIQPQLGKLKQVSGSIPHPAGIVSVDYKINKDNSLNANIVIPEGTTCTFVWKKNQYALKAGVNSFEKLR